LCCARVRVRVRVCGVAAYVAVAHQVHQLLGPLREVFQQNMAINMLRSVPTLACLSSVERVEVRRGHRVPPVAQRRCSRSQLHLFCICKRRRVDVWV
jgi:hypothetical protein